MDQRPTLPNSRTAPWLTPVRVGTLTVNHALQLCADALLADL